jgi:hypothetical protein
VRDVVTFRESISIGSTGAPTFASGNSDDPGVTIARTSTGLYALTYPKGKRVWIQITLVSPARTVVGAIVVAQDATAGTATFNTLAGTNAAAVTDPASGDVVQLTITVER